MILHNHPHQIKRAIAAVAELESADSRFKRVIDKLVYLTGILSIVMAIPQAAIIHVSQSAVNISFVTWFTFLVNAVIWTTYGIIHKERPIIIMYISYLIIDFFIVAGILMYS